LIDDFLDRRQLPFLALREIEMKRTAFISYLFIVVAASLFTQPSDFPKLTGPYLGQKPPGMTPEIFAPGILSRYSMLHGKLVFSPDGLEAFWTCNAAPAQSRWTARQTPRGVWAAPKPSFFSIEFIENSMAYSADGKRLYFHSRRPLQGTGAPKDKDIWYREKTSEGWGDPVPLGSPVNLPSSDESAPSLAADGTLFFSRQASTGAHGAPGHGAAQIDIYYSEWKNGAYAEPVRMGPEINSEHPEIDPVIAPDKSYLIFTSARPDGYSRMMNLYVSFRTADGRWTPAQSLSHTLKIDNIWFPSLSADGAYLFFCGGYPTDKGYTDSRYYWVNTKIIDDLKPKELRPGAQDILRAIQKGDIETVKAILAENPDLAKVKDRWGRTPLHIAVDMNKTEIIEYLIRCGADVEATDLCAYTPLFRAIDRGKKEAAESLVHQGADVNHGMEDGFRAIHLASSHGNAELLEWLLKRGADQNAKDRYGLTPLHIAAAYGFRDVVELLISYKADLKAKSIDGGSPIHFAQAGGHPDIARLILSKGANAESRKYPVFKGKYLGFKGPGPKAEVFLPGVLMHLNPPHNGLAVSPDAKEIYWAETSVNYDLYSRIWFMKEVDGFWTPPRMAPFSSRYLDNYPCFSVDGKRLFFSSTRPLDEKTGPKDSNIWYIEKTKEGWSQPKSIGSSVNTDRDEATPTVDKDGTLFFSRAEVVEGKHDVNIFRSRFLNGQYGEPEKLEENVNSPTTDVYPFVAPGGSYLIYNTGRYGVGFQLCISFLKKDGSWTEAIPIKESLGSFISWCQGISPDGRYLFFAGHKNGVWDIYWMDAGIIEDLKPKELKPVIDVFSSPAGQKDFPVLKGPFLGQKPPGTTTEIFAPGIVSTGLDEALCAFMPDNDEIIFNVIYRKPHSPNIHSALVITNFSAQIK
jgi:ankyrin repeat protein